MVDLLSRTDSPKVEPMGGWKMKTGSFLIAIAGVLTGASKLVPVIEWQPWFEFGAFMVGGVGAAFLAWGAGHKMEKNRSVLIQKKTIPYYVHPMDQEELQVLANFREKKKKPKAVITPAPPTV